MMGGVIIVLPPDDHLDIKLIAKTISRQQVTYMGTVPSQVNEFIAFLQSRKEENLLKTLLCISSGGKI
jgi:acyl-CoA synthetase (AMP-forming)/AMP-acid ligase II